MNQAGTALLEADRIRQRIYEYGKIDRAVSGTAASTGNGMLTFWCYGEKPEADVIVRVRWVKVSGGGGT